jgi:hypothetical protein
LQTSDIRKLCEVPGAVLAAPTSPSAEQRPTFHGEEPQNEGRDCITLEELMDIFVHQDRIYLIKTSMLNRLSRNAERRW